MKFYRGKTQNYIGEEIDGSSEKQIVMVGTNSQSNGQQVQLESFLAGVSIVIMRFDSPDTAFSLGMYLGRRKISGSGSLGIGFRLRNYEVTGNPRHR